MAITILWMIKHNNDGSEIHQLGELRSKIKIYGYKVYLWEGYNIKWHFSSATYINQYNSNLVIHGFSLRAHLTNFKDTIPVTVFCLMLLPCASLPNSFSIFSLLQVTFSKNICNTTSFHMPYNLYIIFSRKTVAKSQQW